MSQRHSESDNWLTLQELAILIGKSPQQACKDVKKYHWTTNGRNNWGALRVLADSEVLTWMVMRAKRELLRAWLEWKAQRRNALRDLENASREFADALPEFSGLSDREVEEALCKHSQTDEQLWALESFIAAQEREKESRKPMIPRGRWREAKESRKRQTHFISRGA